MDTFTDFISKKVEPTGEVGVRDQYGNYLYSYINASKILKTLKENCLFKNQHLAIASRATTSEIAMQAIELFGWKDYFSSIQIYPNSKVEHMNTIKKELKLKSFDQILFFDDELRNIEETTKLGVSAYLISKPVGLNRHEMFNGLTQYSNQQFNK